MLDNEIWYLICIARWVDIRFQVETSAEGSKIWIRCCHQEFEAVCVWYVCMICKLITLSESHQNPVEELKQKNASTCVPKSPPWLSKCFPNTLGEQLYARTWLGYSKRPLFSARSSQGEGHRHSKIASKWSQNQPRLHTAAHVPTNTKVLSDLELQKQVLKGKLGRLSNNFQMLLSILPHLQFSKDVPSVLPVFANH